MKKSKITSLIIILLLAGNASWISSCKDKNASHTHDNHPKELWTCSMHPEIVRDKPGTCPVCGMDLIKKIDNGGAFREVGLNDLLKPTDRFVISSIPVTGIKKKSQSVEIEVLGSVAYDVRLVNTISARVMGRIEKLYVKYRYQHISKGQKIMDIYSPDLLTTEEELLFLIKNDPGNTALIGAARQKLLLLGVNERQVQQIIKTGKPSLTVSVYSTYSGHIHEAGNVMPGTNGSEQKMDISRITEELSIKEGMYIEKGQNIFQVYDISRSWVLLNIFPEYVSTIKTGDPVRIVPETAPASNFRAKIDFIEPMYRKDNKTLTARVYFDNSQLQVPIGSQVKATIFSGNKEADWLPNEAVLSLGIDKVVFLKIDGGFKVQKIHTGLSYNNLVQVLSGLNATDSVAANAQFLADSESFIKTNE